MKRRSAIPPETLELLLSSEAWIAYSALTRLGDPSPEELEKARKASIASPLVRTLVKELGEWPGTPLASHKSAAQLFHRLSLAVELGLRRGDRGASAIGAAVMKHRSAEGPFGLPMKIGAAYGGSGEEQLGWALCDAPVILRSLIRVGYSEEKAILESVSYLAELRIDSGWPCAVSKALGGFRGPGKKTDPCPYATLVMLELLLEIPAYKDGPEIRSAAECLLGLWQNSRVEHPYIFYMGNDFRKLKAPLLWYDLLHILEALTKVEAVAKDKRLADMLDVLEAKAGPDLLFTPESVYQAWKAYDFGQKNVASAYLSTIALGILARAGRVAAPRA
jgi:hypothetical protein